MLQIVSKRTYQNVTDGINIHHPRAGLCKPAAWERPHRWPMHQRQPGKTRTPYYIWYGTHMMPYVWRGQVQGADDSRRRLVKKDKKARSRKDEGSRQVFHVYGTLVPYTWNSRPMYMEQLSYGRKPAYAMRAGNGIPQACHRGTASMPDKDKRKGGKADGSPDENRTRIKSLGNFRSIH